MRESSIRPPATLVLISLCILHFAQGHFYSANSGYPETYATLYSNLYGLAYQQIWNEPSVGVVQVHPPTFHGKYFQKHLFPLWARHVGLAAGEAPVYAAPAAVSLLPLAPVTPYTYTSAHPSATAPGSGATLATYPPVSRPATAAGTPPRVPAAPGEDETATPATDAPKEGEGGSPQTEAAPSDAGGGGVAAPLSATPAAAMDDGEPSVDSGASNNSPAFLGAPKTPTPVTVTVPDADGKTQVVYQFPNLLEGLVQRFQNYFSTYNHITTTSVANAVASANANAVSESASNASSASNSNSASLSDSKSQSESDSSSNSLSGSNAISGANPGPGKGRPADEDDDVDPDGTGGAANFENEGESTTEGDLASTTELPTTTNPPPAVSSTHRQPTHRPPFLGYPPQRAPPRQWAFDLPQRSLSYEVHFTTEAPFNGYRYDRPRLPFNPYREQYRQRSNQWRPIPSKHWEGPPFHSGPQGRSYNFRPRYDSYHYPSRI